MNTNSSSQNSGLLGPLAKEKMLVERRLAEINRLLRRSESMSEGARKRLLDSTDRVISSDESGG